MGSKREKKQNYKINYGTLRRTIQQIHKVISSISHLLFIPHNPPEECYKVFPRFDNRPNDDNENRSEYPRNSRDNHERE